MKPFLVLALSFLVFPLSAQHDAQRNAIWKVARGDGKGFAAAFLNPKVDAGPQETAMVNLLMLVRQGRIDDAIEAAGEALAAGLPAERLLAGSGELLSTLREHPEFNALPGVAEVGAIIHGPMLGNVTGNSASIWVRTHGPLALEAVTVDPSGGIRRSQPSRSTAETDYTLRLEVDGLQPESACEVFLVKEGDEPEKAVSRLSLVTRPARGNGAKFKVAFGGGAGYVPRYHPMWDTIRSFGPDALLMLGDNVYIDDPEHVLSQHYCYHRRQSEPKWRRLVSEVPVYSIYDDHDFGDNDCMPGPEVDTPAWKRPVLKVFQENWVNPPAGGGPENPGCWFEFSIGDVQFFLLDGRYYRHRPSGSMLGEFQKQWLLKGLAESDATFKVIVSPVPFTEGIKPGSRDPWDGYPEEREEIFSWIESKEIDGVFLIAADRHRTDLRATKRENGYPLYEFMSSRLTNQHTHPVVETPGLIWGYRDTCSFGLMEFDTASGDPSVLFRCIDSEGVEHHRHRLRLEEISR